MANIGSFKKSGSEFQGVRSSPSAFRPRASASSPRRTAPTTTPPAIACSSAAPKSAPPGRSAPTKGASTSRSSSTIRASTRRSTPTCSTTRTARATASSGPAAASLPATEPHPPAPRPEFGRGFCARTGLRRYGLAFFAANRLKRASAPRGRPLTAGRTAWLSRLERRARFERRVGVVEPKEPLAVDRLDRRAERVDFGVRPAGRSQRRLADPIGAARRIDCRSAPGRTSHQSSTSPRRRDAILSDRARSDKVDRIEAASRRRPSRGRRDCPPPRRSSLRPRDRTRRRTPRRASSRVRLSMAGESECGRATAPIGEVQSC